MRLVRWEEGVVDEIVEENGGLQILTVAIDSADTHKVRAILYTGFFPPVKPGDVVVLNATARVLGLGTGGYDFVCAPKKMQPHSDEGEPLVPGDAFAKSTKGHMMKLRYTPLQMSVLAAEEPDSPYHKLFNENRDLEQAPVLIGELHSMLPAAVAWLRYMFETSVSGDKPNSMPNIVYVMSDGGALPITFSKHVQRLRRTGWLSGTVTYGHAYGGDVEVMNKFSALIAARHILNAHIIIVTMGPGMAGTGTRWGHTGLETGEIVNAVSTLNGIPIVMPRISFADHRERHYGLSHHVVTAMDAVAMRSAIIPLPQRIDEKYRTILNEQVQSIVNKHDLVWMDEPSEHAVLASHQLYGGLLTTMGRTLSDDPAFFLAVAAAAQAAWYRIKK